MNEAILNQIIANPPSVMHDTAEKNSKLEALYHAVLSFYPEFAEIEVEESATIGDIYSLIGNYFDKQDVGVSLNKENNTLAPEITYQAVTGHAVYDLSVLSMIKETNRFAYIVLLHCVSILSNYCLNSLNHHEWWEDSIKDFYLEEESEPEEIGYYEGAIELIQDFDELHTDYFKVGSQEENIKYLSNLRRNQEYKTLSPKIKGLVFEILFHQKEWEVFTHAETSTEDNDEEATALFTEYIGFGLPEVSDCYDQFLHDHLQYLYENCLTKDYFTITENNKNSIDYRGIEGVIDRFCGIIEATGTTINEVCQNAS